jgi:hypothetical protein
MTSERFWGAGARARLRGPLLEFSAGAADRTTTLGTMAATGGEDEIRITGGLSAGSVGWSLAGEVRRHRWTLTLYVTARQRSRRSQAGIQDFDYEGRVTGLTPGRYRLRVVHLYLDQASETVGAPLVVLEIPVTVGRIESAQLSVMLIWVTSLCSMMLGA